jgi:hypothetical protein
MEVLTLSDWRLDALNYALTTSKLIYMSLASDMDDTLCMHALIWGIIYIYSSVKCCIKV